MRQRARITLEILWTDLDYDGDEVPGPDHWDWEQILRAGDPDSPAVQVRVLECTDITPGGTPI